MGDLLKKVENYLSGKKTYGLVAVGLVLLASSHLGWIQLPQQQLNDLNTALTLSAIAALRAGVK